MTLFLAMFAGNVLGMILFGAVFGWLVRKLIPHLDYATSDLYGLVITIPVAATMYALNGSLQFSFFEMLFFYAFGAGMAYPIMRWARAKDAKRAASGSLATSKGQWTSTCRALGWCALALTFAFGATSMFAAFQGPGGDSVLAFFIGVVLLMASAAIWRSLTKRNREVSSR